MGANRAPLPPTALAIWPCPASLTPTLTLSLNPDPDPDPSIMLCRAYLKGFMLQVAVLANHQNGRDTHIRQASGQAGLAGWLAGWLACQQAWLRVHGCLIASPQEA